MAITAATGAAGAARPSARRSVSACLAPQRLRPPRPIMVATAMAIPLTVAMAATDTAVAATPDTIARDFEGALKGPLLLSSDHFSRSGCPIGARNVSPWRAYLRQDI